MKDTETKINWKARWIWVNEQDREGFHFCYFRKEFLIKEKTKAKLYCTADSKYRVWVNGKYTGFGPARGHPEHPYYDTYNIELNKGKNVVAFLVEHYTKPTSIFAVVEGGLICQIEDSNGLIVATDSLWKAKTAQAYTWLENLLFPECFDANLEPENWEKLEFDDTSWENATEKINTKLAPVSNIIPRIIPLLTEKLLVPQKILHVYKVLRETNDFLDKEKICETLWKAKQLDIEKDTIKQELKTPCKWKNNICLGLSPDSGICMIIDFGFETLSSIEICTEGHSGVIVDFGHSECLLNNSVPTMWQSPSLKQAERIILRNGITCHRTNQPRGFRYMVIRIFNPLQTRCDVILRSVSAYEEIYPAKNNGSFRCSDKIFENIHRLSARTVNLCMEDAYTDCPWRERSQWVGDAQPEALFNYYCFGAYDISKKAVTEFTSGNTEEGWIPGVFPLSKPFNLPTWGMRIPVIVWEYYLFTGDYETLASAYPGVKKQMEWLLKYTDNNGFFNYRDGWNFVDWTKVDDRHADGAVQGWFLESLIYGEKIARQLKDKQSAEKLHKHSELLKKTIAKLYWCEEKKAFKKYRDKNPDKPPSVPDNLIGQQENFLFIRLGVGTKTQRRLALENIAGITGMYLPNLGDYQSAHTQENMGNYIGQDIIRVASPFWSFYALLCLCEAGKIKEAINYIRLCWGVMLEFDATSCWEMWDRHTSLCHGWSAAPAMVLPAYVAGIKPVKPGFKQFEVSPYVFCFEWVEAKVPTPDGIIGLIWRIKQNNQLFVEVDVPDGIEGRFIVPEGFSSGRKEKVLLKSGKNKLVFKRKR